MNQALAFTNLSPKISEPAANSIDMKETQISFPSTGGMAGHSDGLKENVAPERSTRHSWFCPLGSKIDIETMKSFGEVHQITPEDENGGLPPIAPLTCNCAFIRRHAAKIQNASSDEISIIHLSFLVGWDNAERLAQKLRLRTNRPLREILTSAS